MRTEGLLWCVVLVVLNVVQLDVLVCAVVDPERGQFVVCSVSLQFKCRIEDAFEVVANERLLFLCDWARMNVMMIWACVELATCVW